MYIILNDVKLPTFLFLFLFLLLLSTSTAQTNPNEDALNNELAFLQQFNNFDPRWERIHDRQVALEKVYLVSDSPASIENAFESTSEIQPDPSSSSGSFVTEGEVERVKKELEAALTTYRDSKEMNRVLENVLSTGAAADPLKYNKAMEKLH